MNWDQLNPNVHDQIQQNFIAGSHSSSMWMQLDSFPSHGDSETHTLGLTGTLRQQWKKKRVCALLLWKFWRISLTTLEEKRGWIWGRWPSLSQSPRAWSFVALEGADRREADLLPVRRPHPVTSHHLNWGLLLVLCWNSQDFPGRST